MKMLKKISCSELAYQIMRGDNKAHPGGQLLTPIMDNKLSVNVLLISLMSGKLFSLDWRNHILIVLLITLYFFQSNYKGKQNEWYFKSPSSTGNVDHENKLH